MKIVKTMHGMTLVELMVGMAIGLFLLAGVFTAYVNGRAAQNATDDQVAMMDDARFALQVIADDLHQAGMWGRSNDFNTASFNAGDTNVAPLDAAVPGECAVNWADYNQPVTVVTGEVANVANPYLGTCASQYAADPQGDGLLLSDILEVRYTLGNAVANASLQADLIYVQSDLNHGAVFQGTAEPALSAESANQNFPLVAMGYYIANWSNAPSDGIPSLHKISLEPGPVVLDQVLLAGVENLQVQYGVDTDDDGAVNAYVDPGDPLANNWQAIRTVQLWLVIRSQRQDTNISTAQTVTVAGQVINFPNDGWRRYVASIVAQLRNSKNASGI